MAGLVTLSVSFDRKVVILGWDINRAVRVQHVGSSRRSRGALWLLVIKNQP